MATRLLQTVSFVAVGPSATVNLPHQINVNGVPQAPDFVAGDAAGFTISATSTQVSVTNNNAAPASINVWLELKHSEPRQLGRAPTGLTQPSLVPRPFVVASGGGGGGGGGGTQYAFVYRPGGIPHDNVYDDWTALNAAMSAVDGPKLLQFDDSINGVSIPPGTWDMTSTVWEGLDRLPSFGVQTTVQFEDGAEIIGLREIHLLRFENLGPTPPLRDMIEGDVLILSDYTTFAGDNPIVSLENVASIKLVFISVRRGSQILQSPAKITIPASTFGVQIHAEVDKFSLVEANTFDNGGSGNNAIELFMHGSNQITQVQSFWNGNIHQTADISAFRLSNNQTPLMLDAGVCAYYPLGNITTVNLPPAAWHPGAMIVVKNASNSANAITITPSLGDTVNNAASYVIALAQGSAILISDGDTNWMVVAKF